MTAREELVRAIGEAILAEARKWPQLPGDRYGARIAPMGATGDDLGRAVLAVIDAAGWPPTTRCVNDTNGDGDCAACARNPNAPCRQPSLPLPDSETETEHVVEFREDGWTIMHPLACRPNLFDCAVNRAAGRALEEPPAEFGRFACGLAEDGQFVVGDRREVQP